MVGKFGSSDFELTKFLQGKQKDCKLSQDTVQALIVYENDNKKSAWQASDRLCKLFPDSVDEFKPEAIQISILVVCSNI
jgi:hypothetical protein